MKKIFCVLITLLLIFLIYKQFDNHKINYLSIGDGLIRGMNSFNVENYGYNDYIYEYLKQKNKLNSFNNSFYNTKIMNLLEDIKKNRTIWSRNSEFYLKKLLRESDFLVISIGMEELAKNYNSDNMDDNYIFFNKMYIAIEKLIIEIKKYAKGKIVFIGYFNPTNYYDSKTDEFFYNVDIKLNRLMMNNNITYIDLYEMVKGRRFKDNIKTPFLNVKGYKKLAEIIEFYFD